VPAQPAWFHQLEEIVGALRAAEISTSNRLPSKRQSRVLQNEKRRQAGTRRRERGGTANLYALME